MAILRPRDADELAPVSQAMHHFRASDRALLTVDGQEGTLTRALLVGIDDTNGTSFNIGYHQPAFEHKLMSVDGITGTFMTLRLATSDRLYFPWGSRPQACGFLWEFVHSGPSTGETIVSLTNDAGTGAHFAIYWSASGTYAATFHNGTTDSPATLSGTAPTTGQTVRLWGWVTDSGGNMGVTLNQSISSSATIQSASSTPVTRATAWGTGTKLRYSAYGTGAGAQAWHRLGKILPGAPTLGQLLRTL